MKIKLEFIYGIFIGAILESLVVALRYENDLLARETMIFLREGMNPFWTLFIVNVYVLLILPLLIFGIIVLYRKHIKKKKNETT